MALEAKYALIEFYLSLIAYYVLHMIFVIASDFVEAFNIPPLNIGIYVDKMAAIRALLMVIADLLEWAITQKWLHDPGAYSKLTDHNGYRRQGSLLSFLAMLVCRLVYLYLIYFSDNKSLSVFITLCIEGFWFGVFQMSFFAVGPEYNAFTSFGIHTMGNFIFFLQVILQHRAKKKPKINCLYRVRVHGWIVVTTSVIALGLWIWFCIEYTLGDSDEVKALVTKLKEANVNTPNEIANNLVSKMGSGGENKGQTLVQNEFGLDTASVTADSSKNTVTVDAKVSGGNGNGSVKVKITGGGEKFNELVEKLAKQIESQNLSKSVTQANDIAQKLATALNEVRTQIEKMIQTDFKVTNATVTEVKKGSGNDVQVKIGGTNATSQKGSADVNVKGQNITIKIMEQSSNLTEQQGKAIAILLVLALVHKDVKEKAGVSIELASSGKTEIDISVTGAKSTNQAHRIAWKLGKALTKVEEIKVGTSSPETKLKLSLSLEPGNKKNNVSQENVWSPLLLFIVGAFAEDFSVPGILPFAFLDPEKANLVNYLTPSFFMAGALMTVFLNDIFEVGGFAKSLKQYSYFKAWSEGDAPGWHSLWAMNIPKYIAFLIAMWSVHGTYDSLRCIIQSRWRVLILTMTVVVPRAWLETAGYVGVANYAILASETNDYDGFDFIAYHDVLAMFCRFVYGKFAVGYN